MLTIDILMELIERLEKAMRPIGESSDSSDHDRVRQLYQHLLKETAGDPLEQARLTVLHEILEPYLPSVQPTKPQDASAVTYNAKAAIGALVVFLCHLDDCDYETAEMSLQAASQVLHETRELMRGLKGEFAVA
ncbi:MAG: hypothetical protein V3S24_03875 [Candidatus Tectomicrobia bacterium]